MTRRAPDRSFAAMTFTFLRSAGIAGAAATAVCGIVVQAAIQPASTVPDDRWSYPWSSAALVPVSLLYAALHVLVFLGLLGFAGSRVTGAGRGARLGPALALAGTALLCAGELASIPIRHADTADTSAWLVGLIYGAATLLMAIGFLTAGTATLRARRWRGWGRFTPLAAGVVCSALLGLPATKALAAGVALYALTLLALFLQPAGQRQPA
jgi:hypothetical protein